NSCTTRGSMRRPSPRRHGNSPVKRRGRRRVFESRGSRMGPRMGLTDGPKETGMPVTGSFDTRPRGQPVGHVGRRTTQPEPVGGHLSGSRDGVRRPAQGATMSTITVSGHRVTVSHADKTLYPDAGVTKGDVVGYYRTVADAMVPRVRGRPLTLKRFPDGIDGEGWFQKRAAEYFPDWLRVESIPQRGDGSSSLNYAICDDAATLVYLANQASLEFHIWTSTVDNL